jgi:MarR family transcriptional regulator for hemolysin
LATDKDAYLLRDMTRELLLAGRLWRKIARAAAVRHGMSEAAAAPLVWLDRLGENVRQTVLAEAVGIEGASLVRLLDELEGSGLVVRETDPADRRAKAVSLTPRGRKVVEAVNADLEALRLQVFRTLPRKDAEAAMRAFAAIRKAAGEPDDS